MAIDMTILMVMLKVNVFEVKAKLSEFLDRAARGERVIICRHNRPVAELRAVENLRTEPRPVGPLPGRPTFDLPPAFFDALSGDELTMWEGVSATDPLRALATRERRPTRVAEQRGKYTPSRSRTRRRP